MKRSVTNEVLSGKEIVKDHSVLHASRYPVPSGMCTTEEYLRAGSAAGRFELLAPAESIQHSLPHTVHPRLHWRFRRAACEVAPKRFIAQLNFGRVYSWGTVITANNQILRDVSADFYEPLHGHTVLDLPHLPLPVFLDKRVAVVSSIGAPNYYHWLFECLPRLGMLDHDEVDLYYVNVCGDEQGFQAQYLDLLGIPREKLYFAGMQTHIQASNLWVPSLPGQVNRPSRFARDFVRQMLANVPAARRGPERIYVSRRGGTRRRVLNEEQEVWPWLEREGFVRIDPSELTSVVDQMGFFANGKVVVGPFGAALSNVVFCPPGAKVLEFYPPKCMRLNYWALSDVCNHAYGYLLGEGEQPPEFEDPDLGDQDIEVDVAKLKALFRKMGL